MKFLDGAVWAFCVHHFDEYMRFLRNYSSSVDPDDIKQRIVNFEKKKIEFEKSLEEYIARYLETTKFSTTEKLNRRLKRCIRTERENIRIRKPNCKSQGRVGHV